MAVVHALIVVTDQTIFVMVRICVFLAEQVRIGCSIGDLAESDFAALEDYAGMAGRRCALQVFLCNIYEPRTRVKPSIGGSSFQRWWSDITVERSDICTVPAAGVVGEAVIAFEIANAMVEKFGGDSLDEMKRNFDGYQAYVRDF